VAGQLPNLSKKILQFNRSVAQGSFQGVPIHFRMKGKHDSPAIRVLHLDMASLAMDFLKTEPLQCRSTPAGQTATATSYCQLDDLPLLARGQLRR
jgi:hypothetical protein